MVFQPGQSGNPDGRPPFPKAHELEGWNEETQRLVVINDTFNSLDATQKLTLSRQEAYLSAFARSGGKTTAAFAVGLSTQAINYWIEHDTLGFMARFADAQQAFREHLEQITLERIEEGSKLSPLREIFFLNGAWPEKYRPKQEPVFESVARDFIQELRAAVRGQVRAPEPQAAIEAEVMDVTPAEEEEKGQR